MFDKMARSLADTGHYDLHIIGFPSRNPCEYPGIQFHPSSRFARISLRRILRPFAICWKVWSLKPALFIITTHELLAIGALLRWLTGARLVYDVRENYFRNIRYLTSFPRLLRVPIAWYVRIKEMLFAAAVKLFVLSDAGYQDELSFIKRNYLVVENKVRADLFNPPRKDERHTMNLLFSGTLAPSTGIFQAIELATRLHQVDASVRLTIIGYCSLPATSKKILDLIRDKVFIQLKGGDQLVPHSEIVEAIGLADFGIIAYPANPSIVNTIPTKLYEYLAAQLPILMVDHKPWRELCDRYQAAIIFFPENIDPQALLQKMMTQHFYETAPGENLYWEGEFKKLVMRLEAL